MYRKILSSLTLCNASSLLTQSAQLIFSILLQHHISDFYRYFWSTFWSVQMSAPIGVPDKWMRSGGAKKTDQKPLSMKNLLLVIKHKFNLYFPLSFSPSSESFFLAHLYWSGQTAPDCDHSRITSTCANSLHEQSAIKCSCTFKNNLWNVLLGAATFSESTYTKSYWLLATVYRHNYMLIFHN